MADALAARLDTIGRRAAELTRDHDDGNCDLDGDSCTGHDAEAMLAAIRDVLGRHERGRVIIIGRLCGRHENHRHFSITGTEAASITACPDCPADVYFSCAGCGPDVRLGSCLFRAAISYHLLREGGTDA